MPTFLKYEVTDLEKLVTERKQQAEDKLIGYKARIIARYLGEGGRSNESGLNGDGWAYSTKSYQIVNQHFCGGSENTLVENRGELVFEDLNFEVTAYIPGAWERYFTVLYNKAEKVREKEERKKKAKERKETREKKSQKKQDLKNRFGL